MSLTRRTLIIYPLGALLNSFSMTALLLIVGLAGRSELAADIALVQGATLALFYAFSANARNLILADANGNSAILLLRTRLAMAIPLAVAAYILSVSIGGVAAPVAAVLIVRRVSEWMGEIGLARHEELKQPACALQAVIAEVISFSLVLCLLWFGVGLAASAIVWSLVPLFAIRGAKLSLHIENGGSVLRSLAPHFGSTTIIGMSVYVFRLSIVLLSGKVFAGELFTAFAIGGILPTVFGQALAPTLVHRYGSAAGPKWLLILPAAMLMLAFGVTATASLEPVWLVALGRSPTFWLAVGLSIAGGAIMTIAAAKRTKLIHRADGRDVFGPDLLANVLIASCVPFMHYLFGAASLSGLYALSACLSLCFFWGAGHQQGFVFRQRRTLLAVVAALIVLPVFFQVNGGLFRDSAFVFESNGVISRLPLPVSVVALFGGVALLGNYASATRTLTVLFFTALLFVAASLFATHGDSTYEIAKLVLLAQFLLPIFGLVLGQMYAAATREPIFEQTSLAVLLVVLTAQLVATWMQGHLIASPSLYLFSIYQHLQYFPMVVVALAMMIMPALWLAPGRIHVFLLFFIPLSAVQIAASISFMAALGFVIALAGFAIFVVRKGQRVRRCLAVCFFAIFAGVVYGQLIPVADSLLRSPYGTSEPIHELAHDLPRVFKEKSDQWRFYASAVVESPQTVAFGHPTPPDRNQHSSAHNYWLDAMYNFGVIALLPLFALLVWTLQMLWRRSGEILDDPLLFGAGMATVYLLMGENLLKVGMRQPYPGIIIFVIWGLLVGRMSRSPTQFAGPGARL